MATISRDEGQADIATEHDPVWEVFKNAPWDDEPLTDADKQAIKEADENFAAGRFCNSRGLEERTWLVRKVCMSQQHYFYYGDNLEGLRRLVPLGIMVRSGVYRPAFCH